MYMESLQTSPLFSGIAADDIPKLLSCLSAREQSFGRGEYVFRAGENAGGVGIVLSGGVNVAQEDFWGNRSILARIEPGGLFGEAFSCARVEKLPVSVAATADSRVLLIDYAKIVGYCPSTCQFHARLIENMLGILAQKNVMLTEKMEFLSRRSTREKLLAYLSAQAARRGRSSFAIPFSRQELADYLCVDRSAMSAELGKMSRDGLVRFNKNKFELL